MPGTATSMPKSGCPVTIFALSTPGTGRPMIVKLFGSLSGTLPPHSRKVAARLAFRGRSALNRSHVILTEWFCTKEGYPIAVEVFAGNTADPSTIKVQIDKLRQRFGLRRVVLVGDRGMITQARLTEELQPAGLDWITALRAPDIQVLAKDDGPLQLSLFDQRDLVEIASPDYPGAPDRLPQSGARRGAGAQAQRVARRHRAGLARHPGTGAPQAPAARGPRRLARPSAPCSTARKWPST
jgi:hypothetical protein